MDICHRLKMSFKNLRSPVFYKTFFILASITIVSVISSAFLSLKYSSDHIIGEVSKSNMAMLSQKSHTADEKLREIDKMIYQSISDSNVWNIMKMEVLTENHYLMIKDVTKLFNNIILSNDIVNSINLYDTNHLFVITNTTKYTKADFYDQDLFKYGNKVGVVYISPPRIVNNHKVITYIRKFNAFSRDNIGYFAVNLDYDKFFGDIIPKEKGDELPTIVMGADSTPFYYTNDITENLMQSSLQKVIDSRQNYQVYKINGKKYFICKATSEILDWKYISIQEYSSIVKPVDFLIRVIITSMSVVLLLLLILVYKFSTYLYSPLSKLMKNINTQSVSGTCQKNNEYETIDLIIKELYTNNSDLLEKYNIAFPYFQQYSIHELLSNPALSTDSFSLILKVMNIHFAFSMYSIAVIDFENKNIQDTDREFIDNYFKRSTTGITGLVSMVNSFRVLVIMNTSLNSEELYQVIKDIKASLNEKGISSTVSLGNVFTDLNRLSLEYKQVLRQLDSRFFIGKNQIIYNMGFEQDSPIPANDLKLQERLINHVKACNKEKSLEVLDNFIHQHIETGITSIDYTRYLFYQLASSILDHMKEFKIQETDVEVTEFGIFQRIQISETVDALKEFVVFLICRSIDIIEGQKKQQHSEMIESILNFTSQNYTKPLTLDDIASHVFMSPKYLCTLFKDEMGITIFDYITKLRMERAKELLLNSDLQIQNIGMQVGYNNVQSFIRFFKRYWMLTPEQYRRTKRSCSNAVVEEST